MLTVEQIQHAIQSLPEEDYLRFREWFAAWDHDWDDWDRQIAADSKAGKARFPGRAGEEGQTKGPTQGASWSRIIVSASHISQLLGRV